MYLWWSLCTLYLHACKAVRVTVGDSGVCCCTCVTSFERSLTPLCVESVKQVAGLMSVMDVSRCVSNPNSSLMSLA